MRSPETSPLLSSVCVWVVHTSVLSEAYNVLVVFPFAPPVLESKKEMNLSVGQ